MNKRQAADRAVGTPRVRTVSGKARNETLMGNSTTEANVPHPIHRIQSHTQELLGVYHLAVQQGNALRYILVFT